MSQDGQRRDYSKLMKDALVELQQLRARLGELQRAQTEPIAIIGMSCRFPGGTTDPDAFWRLLQGGVDAIGEVPRDRWDAAAYYDPDPDVPGTMSTRYGGFLDGIDRFDAGFFGVSPREARSLDPQQRLLLEVTWEALELAAVPPTQLYGSATGVFVGMSTFDYALHQVGGLVGTEDLARIDGYVATGSTLSPAAGRLSYVLGVNGPSLVVDTACSSSLVAAHLAVTSLRNRECDLAIVGGVNLILRPEWNVNFTKAHMLAPDGRCKTFDASADGYTRGEGCGVVVLQRLSDAQAARRPVVALIRGSAVNQDGASGGLTVPSGPSQEQVIRRALGAAGVQPEEVSYVEAHGTGTSLGDPIEAAALGAVFGAGHTKQAPLRVGSVKTNIGHLEAAAGVAGLIKVALALSHEEIPPHLHFKQGNPMIDWERLPLEVPGSRTPWTSGAIPRRAGISSFGFTGTNAHIVLEEAPPPPAVTPEQAGEERPFHVLALSARSDTAVRALASRYARHLAKHPELALGDVACTANTGRAHFRHRVAVVAGSAAGMQQQLEAFGAGAPSPGAHTGEGERPRVAFLFTGQGSQYVGMGRELYETQPFFRATIDRCDEILRSHLERPLIDVLYPAPDASSPLDDTAYTQPALFSLEYALAALWQSWGIEPEAVMGHSVGEYVAACVAGVFSLQDGLGLIAERARLMQALPRVGEMVAAHTDEARAAAALATCAGDVSLAAVNGPGSVVISGAATAISNVVASMTADGIPTQQLRVSHAFHSPLMEPMLAEFERAARRVAFAPPARNIVSNLTGRFVRDAIASPDYWVRHVRQPVRFAEGMQSLHEHGCQVFLEIGPSSTLLALGRSCLPGAAAVWLPSLDPGGGRDRLLHSLAELYARGAQVDWSAFHRDAPGRPVALPTYPFQRQRYWVEVERRDRDTRGRAATAPAANRQDESAEATEHDVRNLLYAIEWRARPRTGSRSTSQAHGRWIVLTGGDPLGNRLAAQLQQNGASCTIVTAGDRFARHGVDRFDVNPERSDDLEQLWAAVSAEGPIQGIVYLGGLDAGSHLEMAAGNADSAKAVARALSVVRAVARNAKAAAPIWCVTRGAVAAGDSTALALAQAPLWGFGRGVAAERPELWGGSIDLDADAAVEREALALADELLVPDGEDQIAFRHGARYVPRLVRRELPGTTAARLDPDATYLVVGGLGALGLHAARWLVSRGARSLVLAGRRGRATPGAEDAIRSLEAMGAARVTAVGADVSRPDEVDRLLNGIRASGARLRGVVLAAGTDAPVPLTEMTRDDLESMLAAKREGGWLLHDRTRDGDLDFFLCFSSVSSIWGAPGRTHYAAANASLDALVHERRRLGLPALAVNWGPWRGGGMASDEAIRHLELAGNRALEPAVALRALDTLCGDRDAQVLAADIDWPRFRAAFEARRHRPLFSEIETAVPEAAVQAGEPRRADWIEPLQEAAAAERPTLLLTWLRTEMASVLGYSHPSEVPPDRHIVELGMDSLRAVELTMRLQRHLGLRQPVQILECATLRDLSCRLLREVALSEPEASEPESGATATLSPPLAVEDGVTGWAPELERDIFEFARIAWPQRPEHLVERRWRWMFLESAERCGVTPRVWLYRQDGKVVAHHGAMPVRLKVGSEMIDSGWFADTMVLESHRAAATGARLIVDSNEAFTVGLSLGQTASMREIALQLGWTQVSPLRTYLLSLNPRRILRDKLHPLVAGMAGIGLRARQDVKRRLAGSGRVRLDVRPLACFDARHDRLWESVKGAYPCAVARDASYLNWKYVAQPGQDFVRLELARNDEPVALVVLTLDEPGPIYRYRRALIADVVVPPSDPPLVLAVIDAVRSHCAAAQVDAILFHLINDPIERILESYGFLQRPATRILLVDSQRVSPEARQLLHSPENWLITMGDSDIDRPWETADGCIQSRATMR